MILQGAIPGVSVLSVLQLLSLGPQPTWAEGQRWSKRPSISKASPSVWFSLGHHGTTLLCWKSASWKDFEKTHISLPKMSGMLCEVPTSEFRVKSAERDLWWKTFRNKQFQSFVSRALCDLEIKSFIKIRRYSVSSKRQRGKTHGDAGKNCQVHRGRMPLKTRSLQRVRAPRSSTGADSVSKSIWSSGLRSLAEAV